MSPTVIAAIAQLGIGSIAQGVAALSPAARAERRQSRQDVKDLKANNFGYSEAEKQQKVATQLAAIRAQSQAAQDAMGRQQAASGGAQSGAAYAAQQKIASNAESQAGDQLGTVQALSEAKAQADRAAAMQRVAAQAARNRAAAKQVSDTTSKAIQTAMGGGGADLTGAIPIAKGG
jgi:hypothetical protein